MSTKTSATTGIRLLLEQGGLIATPGNPAAFRVELTNIGALAAEAVIGLSGLPDSWLVQPLPTVYLHPNPARPGGTRY